MVLISSTNHLVAKKKRKKKTLCWHAWVCVNVTPITTDMIYVLSQRLRKAAKEHVCVTTYQKSAPTCHGHLPKEDFSPPTIRDSGNRRRPHTERMSNVVLMEAAFILSLRVMDVTI
jgi:hypothetical protein